ncbi:MAG: hypothetical protein AAB835_00395 [Patescibacteria group bacterium]
MTILLKELPSVAHRRFRNLPNQSQGNLLFASNKNNTMKYIINYPIFVAIATYLGYLAIFLSKVAIQNT